MATSSLILAILALLSEKILTSEIGCSEKKYICRQYKSLLTDTIILTEDRTLCSGKCYRSSICNGTWSNWTTTKPIILHTSVSNSSIGKYCTYLLNKSFQTLSVYWFY